MAILRQIVRSAAPFKIQVLNEKGEVEYETFAESYYVITKDRSEFKTNFAPADYIFQLGLLHFALNQVNNDQANRSAPR